MTDKDYGKAPKEKFSLVVPVAEIILKYSPCDYQHEQEACDVINMEHGIAEIAHQNQEI